MALELKITVSEQKELKNSVEDTGFKVSDNEPPHEVASRITLAFGLQLEQGDKFKYMRPNDTKSPRLILNFKEENKKTTMSAKKELYDFPSTC